MARRPAGEVTRVETLAAEGALPPNYLVQILIELKASGLVRSIRGKDGGYQLARPASEITFADVLRAIHGPLFDSPAISDNRCPAEIQEAWRRLQTAVEREAATINFQQLLEGGAERNRMFYI